MLYFQVSDHETLPNATLVLTDIFLCPVFRVPYLVAASSRKMAASSFSSPYPYFIPPVIPSFPSV